MRLEPLWKIARSGRLRTLRALQSVATEYTRACFLVAASRAGVITALANEPLSLQALSERLRAESATLSAWLDVGIALGELAHGSGGFRLHGVLARALANPENDDVLAMLEELTGLHQRLVLEAPDLAVRRGRWTLADQSGSIVARSSRLAEPLIQTALLQLLPTAGRFRVLEIGCGSGTYLSFMAGRNPELEATGLELQPEVAELAKKNLAAWGISERVKIVVGDVRSHVADAPYDLVTLHQNIYYFGVEERVALLTRLREMLVPGGKILITSATVGGSASLAVLNLWGAVTEGCGPLPVPEEMILQLEQAGFGDCRTGNLAAPFDRFHSFVATRR